MVYTDVVGHEGLFSISQCGQVFSKRSGRVIKTRVHQTGYLTFATKIGGRDGSCHMFRVHRFLAETFIPNPDKKTQVNHIDGDKLNNDLANLEWSTPSENMKHAYRIGLSEAKAGADNYAAKLTSEQVAYIRGNPDNLTHRALAKIFRVAHTTIGRCKNKLRYSAS